jgi:hypothetical protein
MTELCDDSHGQQIIIFEWVYTETEMRIASAPQESDSSTKFTLCLCLDGAMPFAILSIIDGMHYGMQVRVL